MWKGQKMLKPKKWRGSENQLRNKPNIGWRSGGQLITEPKMRCVCDDMIRGLLLERKENKKVTILDRFDFFLRRTCTCWLWFTTLRQTSDDVQPPKNVLVQNVKCKMSNPFRRLWKINISLKAKIPTSVCRRQNLLLANVCVHVYMWRSSTPLGLQSVASVLEG